jgi:hypothetical protein
MLNVFCLHPLCCCVTAPTTADPTAAAAAAAAAGKPTDSGISLQAVRELGPDFPLFGVCMGHQCIGEAFGGALVIKATRAHDLGLSGNSFRGVAGVSMGNQCQGNAQ